MAEFIPTDEEKAAASYLDWDDAELGKFTKNLGLTLERMKDAASAAMLLVSAAHDANAGTLELTLTDHSRKGVHTGNWRITVEKIDGTATA